LVDFVLMDQLELVVEDTIEECMDKNNFEVVKQYHKVAHMVDMTLKVEDMIVEEMVQVVEDMTGRELIHLVEDMTGRELIHLVEDMTG
jgi:hypothetical protein